MSLTDSALKPNTNPTTGNQGVPLFPVIPDAPVTPPAAKTAATPQLPSNPSPAPQASAETTVDKSTWKINSSGQLVPPDSPTLAPGWNAAGINGPSAATIQTARTNGGTYTGKDGKQYYSYDSSPVSTTSTTTTGTSNGTQNTGTGTPALPDQPDREAMAQAQAEYQRTAQSVQDTISNIQSGVIPLTAGEQAQLTGLQQQFQALIDSQVLTNKGATGIAQTRGYQSGAAEYDPTFQAKTIGTIISAGAAKVSDLMVQEAAAVAKLTQGFKDADIKTVKDAWDIYKEASKNRTDALQKTIDDTAKAIKDANDAKIAADKVTYDTVTKPIQDVATEAAKNGADATTLAKINAAPTVAQAVQAAGDLLQTGTGDVGDYLYYKRNATALGQTPQSFDSYITAKKYKEAYAAAEGTAAGKIAGEGKSTSSGLTQSNVTSKTDFPQSLKPYARQSANGNWYLDLSSIGSAQRPALIEQAGDIPVITDKNAAADLTNIHDANSKLQTIAGVVKDLTSSSALSRDLGGAGLTALAAVAQTDPKKAAAGALNDVALDLLKAISGVQGFRGNQTAIQQIKDTLPKITDTQDVAQAKLETISQLINDREEALVGTGSNDTTSFLIRTENQAKDALIDSGKGNGDMQNRITGILSTVNPETGQNYSYLDAAQILGIPIPALKGLNTPGVGSAGQTLR